MNRRMLMGAIPLSAAVAAAIWWMRPSDEARIRKGMAELIATIEKTAAESPIAAVQRAGKAAGWFTEDCAIRIDRPELGTIASQNELRQSVFRVRALLDELRVSLHDETVTVDPDRAGATHHFTARAQARRQSMSESAVQEIEAVWRRTPDGWRIRSVETVQAIRQVR